MSEDLICASGWTGDKCCIDCLLIMHIVCRIECCSVLHSVAVCCIAVKSHRAQATPNTQQRVDVRALLRICTASVQN